jgi:hypothetical protein
MHATEYIGQFLGLGRSRFRYFLNLFVLDLAATVPERKWPINNRNPLEQDVRVDCRRSIRVDLRAS